MDPISPKSCNQKERNALLELKKSLLSRSREGHFHYVLPTWTNDIKSDCCQWKGVECNRTSGRVIKLSFGYKSLRRLRNLEILDLSWNELNKSRFPFLNAATSLTTLFLGPNWMNGPLRVKELRDLTNLELLDLSGNGINGSIPIHELTFLRKLTVLDLNDNEISGSMGLQEFTALRKLKALGLSGNKFSGSFELQGKFAQII
ncbi:unnamed protein product [Arabidopsis halleri]